MQDPTDKLTPKQVKVLTLLLAGKTIDAAAQEVGVNPATVHRWMKEDAFRAARDASQREVADLGLSLMLSLVRKAVGVLATRLDDHMKPHLQERAAEFVIEHALEWMEIKALADRIAALEERYAQNVR